MSEVISNIIAGAGVLITAGFSLAVLIATKKTTEVADATLKLSEELASKEEKRIADYNKIMRRQLVPHILIESRKIHDAVVDTVPMEIHRKLSNAPVNLDIDMKALAEYFTEDEVKLILNAWETYDDYRRKYFKMNYNGNEINSLLENSPSVITVFHDLLEAFKKIKFD